MTDEIVLRALDGSNPLAFLAALGTLRLLTLETHAEIQMAWDRLDGFWRPKLRGLQVSEEELCETLLGSNCWAPIEEFVAALGKNIKVSADKFRPIVDTTCITTLCSDRRAADFVASFGCEACEDENHEKIQYSDFCFITGSGHQDFLGTIAKLKTNVTSSHLYDALFGEWRREEAEGMSMRWDPSDAAEYALQWTKPSLEGASAILGANRLAIEALPYFPTAPVKGGLQTTGFNHRNGEVKSIWPEFTWPIWEHFITFASVRSLVSFAELQKETPDRKTMSSMGLAEIYRSQRVRIPPNSPQYKVSFRPARAV